VKSGEKFLETTFEASDLIIVSLHQKLVAEKK
jgi:hypothetical protein